MKTAAILLWMLVIYGCSDKEQLGEANHVFIANDIIRTSGEIASSESIIISPPHIKGMWQHKIVYMAPEGVQIKEGERLIEFESSSLEQKLHERQNALLTAKRKFESKIIENDAKHEALILLLAEALMNHEKAELKWRQSRGLESKIETKKLALLNQITADDIIKYKRTINKNIETGQAILARLSNDVLRLQNEVKQHQAFIQKMKVTSPRSGVVIYKTNQMHVKYSIGDNVWIVEKIIELTSPVNLIIKAEILEADAGRVAVGQEVDIVLDAAPDRIFKGQIISLGSVFRRKSRGQPNIIIDAKVSIDLIDQVIMRPGMAARLQIVTKSAKKSGDYLT
ncbi:MAG: efflux RND transporter periplasmic adaptor subunit [Gammaproteobacteria bacterium]|nr:efflux RND transporter periplasmic adaptor subunit [Gammaproteobacteria bacterium]